MQARFSEPRLGNVSTRTSVASPWSRATHHLAYTLTGSTTYDNDDSMIVYRSTACQRIEYEGMYAFLLLVPCYSEHSSVQFCVSSHSACYVNICDGAVRVNHSHVSQVCCPCK